MSLLSPVPSVCQPPSSPLSDLSHIGVISNPSCRKQLGNDASPALSCVTYDFSECGGGRREERQPWLLGQKWWAPRHPLDLLRVSSLIMNVAGNKPSIHRAVTPRPADGFFLLFLSLANCLCLLGKQSVTERDHGNGGKAFGFREAGPETAK